MQLLRDLPCQPVSAPVSLFFFFFFNDTATTEIYTLSLHDALPIPTHRRPTATTCSKCIRNRRRCHSTERRTTTNGKKFSVLSSRFSVRRCRFYREPRTENREPSKRFHTHRTHRGRHNHRHSRRRRDLERQVGAA